jgi:hypothetical protein
MSILALLWFGLACLIHYFPGTSNDVYTAGDPNTPGTLHYINPDRSPLNEYETAIMTVGSFIAKYDTDQRIPVWG